jgi:hypothetical protein
MIEEPKDADTPPDPDDSQTQSKSSQMHDSLPVHGYMRQSGASVGLVNFHKEWEERVLRHLDWLAGHEGVDKRWLAIGRTQIEKAFMAVNRAVFKPGRISLPEDKDAGKLPENQKPFRAKETSDA